MDVVKVSEIPQHELRRGPGPIVRELLELTRHMKRGEIYRLGPFDRVAADGKKIRIRHYDGMKTLNKLIAPKVITLYMRGVYLYLERIR